jgi:hypothetical protein
VDSIAPLVLAYKTIVYALIANQNLDCTGKLMNLERISMAGGIKIIIYKHKQLDMIIPKKKYSSHNA